MLVAVGLVAVLVLTLLLFGLEIAPSLGYLAQGAFGDVNGVSRTLVKTTPLLLTALGIAVAWRAGMYNIGGEGQYVVGGLTGAWFAQLFVEAAPQAASVGILLCSVVGGAFFAWIAAVLYVKRGIQVVISTILLNFVALQLLSWAVSGPLQESRGNLPLSERLPNDVMLLRFSSQNDLHAGVFVALLAAVAVGLFLFASKSGYKLRLVGANPDAARANGYSTARSQTLAMLVSGGLCGLAGGVEYVGLAGQLGTGFAQEWGFIAIPVALLGGLHPIGVTLSSLYFGALFAGSETLSRYSEIGPKIVFVIQGIAVLAFVGFLELLKRREAKGSP